MSSLWDEEPGEPIRELHPPDAPPGREAVAPRRLGQLTEVIASLGVSRAWLYRLRQRPDFPLPVESWAKGPVWDLDEVERWWQQRRATNYRGRQDWLDDQRVG